MIYKLADPEKKSASLTNQVYKPAVIWGTVVLPSRSWKLCWGDKTTKHTNQWKSSKRTWRNKVVKLTIRYIIYKSPEREQCCFKW